MCGFLAWKKESGGPAKIGQRLFSDMKSSGEDSWAGAAFNPQDGKRYTAKLTVSGDHLVTAGCVLGGLICQSFDWTRTSSPGPVSGARNTRQLNSGAGCAAGSYFSPRPCRNASKASSVVAET